MTDSAMTRREALGLAAAAVLAAATLPGCNGAKEEDDRKEDAEVSSPGVVMGVSVDPDGLDPHRTAAAATFQITANVFDTLLGVTPDGRLTARLAKDWEVSDDGLTITFHLRDDAVFSNGDKCDAAACASSFARLLDPASPRVSQYKGYTFVATDATTLVVTLSELNTAALTDFAYAWSAVVDVAAMEEGDGESRWPVGSGPYAVKEWVPQQRVLLEANPSYWGESPSCSTVEFKILPDETSKVTSLRAGNVDIVEAPSEAVASLSDDDRFKFVQAPQNGVQLMAMNCANAALADVRVRQAINLAINKDEVIDAAWSGLGEKIGSHFPTVINGYVDCNDVYAYDPDAAAELLKEAGYSEGLTLRMRLPKDYQTYVDAGQIIADMLGRVGIVCEIEIVQWATWLDEVYNGRDYDLTVVGHTGRLDPITLLARYTSDSSENYFNYASDEVDELVAAYRNELDEDARLGIVEQLQRKLAQDVPAVYLQDPITTYAMANKVDGFVMYPIDVYEFKDVTVGA